MSSSTSMSVSSKSSTGDHNDESVKDTNNAKPWPRDDAIDFLSDASTNTSSTNSPLGLLIRHIVTVLSSPRQFVSIQRDALLYSYMSPVLRRGADNHRQRRAAAAARLVKSSGDEDGSSSVVKELSKQDLYAVPASMESRHLSHLFWRSYQQQRRRNEQPSATSFLKLLWIIAKPTFLIGGYWQLITVLCQCSLPLLVRRVLLQLEQSPMNHSVVKAWRMHSPSSL